MGRRGASPEQLAEMRRRRAAKRLGVPGPVIPSNSVPGTGGLGVDLDLMPPTGGQGAQARPGSPIASPLDVGPTLPSRPSIVTFTTEVHGGRIWVKSRVGVDSTFTFTLPVRRGE